MTKLQEIQKLIDTIHVCEVSVMTLKYDPPANLCFNERKAYEEEFRKVGAKAVMEYYRLTKEYFCEDSSSEQESA